MFYSKIARRFDLAPTITVEPLAGWFGPSIFLPFFGNMVTIDTILSSPRLVGTHLYISYLIWCVFYPLLPNLAP